MKYHGSRGRSLCDWKAAHRLAKSHIRVHWNRLVDSGPIFYKASVTGQSRRADLFILRAHRNRLEGVNLSYGRRPNSIHRIRSWLGNRRSSLRRYGCIIIANGRLRFLNYLFFVKYWMIVFNFLFRVWRLVRKEHFIGVFDVRIRIICVLWNWRYAYELFLGAVLN